MDDRTSARATAPGRPDGGHASGAPEARILPATRWTAILILPFLLGAWAILYLFPLRTAELFAWPIKPAMTALLMGSGYLAGAYFFWQTAVARDWRFVSAGFLPVAIFAGWMAAATLIHWSRFNQGHPAFLTWVTLYAVTPFLFLALWLRNRRVTRGESETGSAVVPHAVRLVMGLLGVGMLLAGLFFFIFPEAMIAIWPWMLTPLTARACLGFLILPALTEISLAFHQHWSAYRAVIRGQVIALVLILAGVVRARQDLQFNQPAAWFFLTALVAVLLATALLYLGMEARERRKAG